MKLNKTIKFSLPFWGAIILGLILLGSIGSPSWLYFKETKHSNELGIELNEYYNENSVLKDSLKILNMDIVELTTAKKRLERNYKNDKITWERERERLLERIHNQDSSIVELEQQRDSLTAEKNRLAALVSTGIEGMEMHQIDQLKKKIRAKELELKNKDRRLFEIREAKERAIVELRNVNQRLEKNELFFDEMSRTIVDFYKFLMEMDNEYYDFVKDIEEKLGPGDEGVLLAEMTSHEDKPVWVNIPAKEKYGGSPWLNEIQQRMENLKLKKESVKNWESKIRATMNEYDYSLGVSQDLLDDVKRMVTKLEERDLVLLENEIKIRSRYLLIASTEELKKLGILKRRDWKRAIIKRRIDLTRIRREDFTRIDFELDTIIQLPERKRFRSLITNHVSWSRAIDYRNNTLQIVNKNKFWELSNYMIIETD
ncbi:hypothetical protein [Flagellimonas sp. S3867]|uniref:hypothetical protein n=1 Tax=Flagellimonas sp. S3867 TaxID=2768063 RepID=UPI0016866312|nr:hypothetical protein [Flagellimonas sp. S3867]